MLPLSQVGILTSTGCGTEAVLGELLEDQADAERHEQRVERTVVHAPQEETLDQQADRAGDDECHRQGDHEGQPGEPGEQPDLGLQHVRACRRRP